MRLEVMQDGVNTSLQRIITLLEARGGGAGPGTNDAIEEELQEPFNSAAQLEEFCRKLEADETYKKRIVRKVITFQTCYLMRQHTDTAHTMSNVSIILAWITP